MISIIVKTSIDLTLLGYESLLFLLLSLESSLLLLSLLSFLLLLSLLSFLLLGDSLLLYPPRLKLN